jgi:hypothetical protein
VPGTEDEVAVATAATAAPAEPVAPPAAAAPGVVDPMQWWGALTKQFTELATTALKDTDAARSMAGATAAPVAKRAAGKKAAPKAAATRKKASPRTR